MCGTTRQRQVTCIRLTIASQLTKTFARDALEASTRELQRTQSIYYWNIAHILHCTCLNVKKKAKFMKNLNKQKPCVKVTFGDCEGQFSFHLPSHLKTV